MDIIISKTDELREIIRDEITKAVGAIPQQKVPAGKEVFTNREAMDFLGVSRSTLQRWREDGLLPYRKIHGSIRYTRADLDKALEGGKK